MSAVNDNILWSNNQNKNKLLRYEKCRNITEEIYKRINLTFEIKKREQSPENDSEHSDQIDSNELSNTTDMFAYEESLSISSSACEAELKQRNFAHINNNNNNNIDVSKSVKSRRLKKKFRKRVKKHRPSKGQSESEESSDENLKYNKSLLELDPANKTRPYADHSKSESPDNVVMGVPKITILTGSVFKIKETKSKHHTINKTDKSEKKSKQPETSSPSADTLMMSVDKSTDQNTETKQCNMCNSTFRGDRGLRRHMALSHILFPEDITRTTTRR